MNRQELESLVKQKTAEFVKDLDGRYKEHVSDEFIQSFIEREFMIVRRKNPDYKLDALAYHASVVLFEQHLESGCKIISNGHHVAQNFSKYFTEDK